MLAKIAPLTNDFRAVARYLVGGKSGSPGPNRVAWTISQNLPTTDPDLAAIYMAATAEASARTRKPAYHLMIAWHARERPAPELMQDVALQTLALAGLGEHQALVMGHGDKPHPHLHILLNRVHPDTGRAWRTAHDYATFDRIMRALSDTHGFEYAPAHLYNPELTDACAKGPGTRATRASQGGASTSRPQWSRKASRDLGDLLSDGVAPSSSLDEVLALLGRCGLQLEAKGRGHVIGNAEGYSKLSSIPLAPTAQALNRVKVAGVSSQPRKMRRRIFDVDGVDITRAMVTLGLAKRSDIAAAVRDRQREREVEVARHALLSATCLTSYGTAGASKLRAHAKQKLIPARLLRHLTAQAARPVGAQQAREEGVR